MGWILCIYITDSTYYKSTASGANNIFVLVSSIKKNIGFCVGAAERSEGLAIYWGICLVCSSCLPPCQCPPWHCLGSLVHFVSPFLSYPQWFGILICSVLSCLLSHLSDWYHIRVILILMKFKICKCACSQNVTIFPQNMQPCNFTNFLNKNHPSTTLGLKGF